MHRGNIRTVRATGCECEAGPARRLPVGSLLVLYSAEASMAFPRSLDEVRELQLPKRFAR